MNIKKYIQTAVDSGKILKTFSFIMCEKIMDGLLSKTKLLSFVRGQNRQNPLHLLVCELVFGTLQCTFFTWRI